MNLKTTYLGLKLRNPIIIGASPILEHPDTAKKLEDAGAAAIVLHPVSEEQVERERIAINKFTEDVAESHPEATSYFPNYDDYRLPSEAYIWKIERLKETLSIPVIGSLRCSSMEGWLRYAKQIEAAGADAVELNPFKIVSDPNVTETAINEHILSVVRTVSSNIKIPVAVKMSPFHSSLANLAMSIDESGASGMVLFNRFYRPDADKDGMSEPQSRFFASSELLLRLRWLSILSPLVKGSLAASGGIYSAEGLIKALLSGSHGVQIASPILRSGPDVIPKLLAEIKRWMERHEIDSIDALRNSPIAHSI